MRQNSKPISQPQIIIEQIALLATSFIWTTVILSLLVFFWVYQDLESNWDIIFGITTNPKPEPALALAIESTATPTPWPGLPPSVTPTETVRPTSTATQAIVPPAILPETLNVDEPTPIPIVVHTAEEVADYLPTPIPTQAAQANPPAPSPPPETTGQSEAPSPAARPQVVTPVATSPPPTATPPPAEEIAVPTRLVIPSVKIDSKVIPVGWTLVEQNGKQYSIWQVADYAIGWHNTSAVPGQVGNVVMAGHHNINGEVFRNLVNVEVGDEVVVYTGQETRRYQIELKTIVKEKGEPPSVRQKNAQWIAPTTDERITMVTCWPYTNNTHRVIVVAKPAS